MNHDPHKHGEHDHDYDNVGNDAHNYDDAHIASIDMIHVKIMRKIRGRAKRGRRI